VVEVEVDVGGVIVRVEEQQLIGDDVGDVVVELGAQEHAAVHQHAAEDVVGAFAAARPLDDVGRVDLAGRLHACSTVDCDRRNANTFSSVMLRSTSRSRFAFSSDAYNCSGGISRRAASSWMRWSSSASLACSFSCSTT